MSQDPRKIIGAKISALAYHVTSLAECSRRYGSNAKRKRIEGVVKAVEGRQTKTGRTSCYIHGEFDLGGGMMKRNAIYITQVKIVPVADTIDDEQQGNQPVQSQPSATPDNSSAATTVSEHASLPPTNVQNWTVTSVTNTPVPIINTLPTMATLLPQSTTPRPMNIEGQVDAERGTSLGYDHGPESPYVTCHEKDWFSSKDHLESTDRINDRSINGAVNFREWKIKTTAGDELRYRCDTRSGYSRLDYFMMMFPHSHLEKITRLTNIQLKKKNKKETTISEILKWFGVILLCTKYEFSSRRSLWKTTSSSAYVAAPNFGKTGMTRGRFDDLWCCARFSDQPEKRPENMQHENYRWLLVDDFVEAFNDHRKNKFVPSELICADESISRWYGQGGSWINLGLPMYVAIDRKPEYGCEIQNICCGRSGVMLKLRLVKSAALEEYHTQMNEEGIIHGAAVLKDLVINYANSNRIVCADSYFASVQTCEVMKRIGLRFIGVVKNCSKQFPMAKLSEIELEERGDSFALVSKDIITKKVDMFALVWMDRNRRYFVANTSTINDGRPYNRTRWRQVDTTVNAEAEQVELVVRQPKICEIYYDVCGMIDQHNRHRQDTLMIERKLVTDDWSKRVNLSILSMIMVDTWLVYNHCTNPEHEVQKSFYEFLAEELIDNNYDETSSATSRRRRQRGGDNRSSSTVQASRQLVVSQNGHLKSGSHIHLTPTKEFRRYRGEVTKCRQQSWCKICKRKKSKYLCSICLEKKGENVWLCHTDTLRSCFADHVEKDHSVDSD